MSPRSLCSRPREHVRLAAVTVAALTSTCAAQFTAYRLHPSEMSFSRIFAVRGGRFGGTGRISTLPNYDPPAIWNSPSPNSWTSLVNEPAPGQVGAILAMSATQQAGTWAGHASLWSGTPSSMIDLNPSGARASYVHALDTDTQAGYAYFGTSVNQTAGLWNGSAQSWVNLHPSGALYSAAYAASNNRQGGQAVYPDGSGYAVIWSGSSASMVTIGPANHGSTIFGMSGDQQVGWVSSATMPQHAALWNGTASSFRDLNPFGGQSVLYATCGTAQVGWESSTITGGQHAAVWFGTPESCINLRSFLPSNYGLSVAQAIDFQDGVYTIGGWARNNTTGADEAFVWVGVPAPNSAVALIIAAALTARRSRRPLR